MRVRVDHKADAVYLNLTDHEIAESEEVADPHRHHLQLRQLERGFDGEVVADVER
ncbi:MAG: DUF2283 domain-containing protein, partial [Rhodomicrobium sp.]